MQLTELAHAVAGAKAPAPDNDIYDEEDDDIALQEEAQAFVRRAARMLEFYGSEPIGELNRYDRRRMAGLAQELYAYLEAWEI